MVLGIVLPSYNRKNLLRETISQLVDQSQHLNQIQTEIIVVIDGSTDGSIEMIKNEFDMVHIVMGNGNWFYTKSMNEGFKYAQKFNPDYILTLNDDIILGDNYLKEMTSAISKVEPNSIIGCVALTENKPHRILFSGEKKYISWRQKHIKYHSNFKIIDDEELKGIHPSVILPGRGMLIPNSVLKEVNYFDEYFVQYHSDTDFCLRAGKAGYKIYISWDARLLSYIEETAGATSYMKTSWKKFINSYFNIYSRVFIPHKAKLFYRHGKKVLWPITMVIFFMATLKAFLFNKKLV